MMELERRSQTAAHWSLQQYENLFAITASRPRSDRLAWVAEQENAEPQQVPGKTSTIVGFLVAHRTDFEWELENIVVAEPARRQGVGTLLLQKLVFHVRQQCGSSVFLEVRESNQGARALYRKLGFEEAGLRKNYYPSPPEDAILYRLAMC